MNTEKMNTVTQVAIIVTLICFSIAFCKTMYRADKVSRKVVEICEKTNIPVNSETNNILGWKYVKVLGD